MIHTAVKTRQSKERKAKNLQANNNLKPHRLRADEEIISKISSLHVRLISPNKSIVDGKGFPKTGSLIKACQGLLDNTSRPASPKKRRG